MCSSTHAGTCFSKLVTLGAWLKTAFQYTPLRDQSLMLNSLYTSQNGVPGCGPVTQFQAQYVCSVVHHRQVVDVLNDCAFEKGQAQRKSGQQSLCTCV